MRVLALIALWCVPALVLAQAPALQELRYCGPPARTSSGKIKRRADVLVAFERFHPCPVSNAKPGTCPGWQIDHVIPLACGGCDAVSNLQWLPVALKTAPAIGKDRFERVIYERGIPCR
jgi:hypothetical protein